MFKFPTFLVAAFAICFGLVAFLKRVPDPPSIDELKWWGNEPKGLRDDEQIRPFHIEFNDTMINDLKQRLKNRRPLTKPLDGIMSEYGINTVYLEKIINYWINNYDFKARASRLNKFAHYKTRIQGLDIHFIRAKPEIKAKKTLPLLMLHGWPSSSKEFDKVIPMLINQRSGYDFVFDVIVADLPGFGYSEGSNKPGLTPIQIGVIMRNLMRRVGYNKFYIHGGDWGSQIATHMATLFPSDILGLHTNMPLSSRPISVVKALVGSLFPSLSVDPKYVNRIYPLKNLLSYILRESGYFHIQATKPDTIGVALTDSPTGLAAYIMEKMAICSNRDQTNTLHGGLENLEIDDVLDTITIIWVNNCIVTSSRIYAEGIGQEVHLVHNIPTEVPTAAINFRYEVLYQPDWILRDKFLNLVRSTTLDVGGHFAALQTPNELIDDIYASFAQILEFNGSKNLV
ncbi:juvenile hormone epoxide hydrolase-like [Battus philenor]|uniref:juvenile hormone epoxide hydrolase-like n=1 Tax=Battus philenor TaxID=42288 RepID=UPI0035CF57D0